MMDSAPRLISSCSVCEAPQKSWLVQGSPLLVQADHSARKFRGALSAHLEAVQALIVTEHEASVKSLQTENHNLRDKLKAVDSAVHGPETYSIISSAEPKDGSPKGLAYGDSRGSVTRLSPVPNAAQASPSQLVRSEAKVDSEDVLTRKAFEELRSDFVNFKRDLQDVASVCADLKSANSRGPASALAHNIISRHGEDADLDCSHGQEASWPLTEVQPNTQMTANDEEPVSNPRKSYFHADPVEKQKTLDLAIYATRTPLERIVYSPYFEMTSGFLIIANILAIACQLQYDGFDAGHEVSYPKYKGSKDTWPGANQVFYYADFVFNALFTLELILRFGAIGLKAAVRSLWMWFDTCIVTLSLVDLIANEVSDGGIGMNPTMMRVARLMRLVRMLKVFKTMTAFDSLYLLLKSIKASCSALLWSFLLLFCVQTTIGLFLCQLLNSYILDEDFSPEARRRIFSYFGTFTRTMITMFEITLGNWVPTCRDLMEHVSEYYMAFYIVYRCMFCFAVLKVIAAVFIAETNRVLLNDDELTMLKTRREKAGYMRKLRMLFNQMDSAADGELDMADLENLLEDDYMVSWLATLGFEGHDFEKIFNHASRDKDGKVHLSEFLDKVVKAKGQAKTIDLFRVMQQLTEIEEGLAKLEKGVRDHNSALLPTRIG